jgi:tRNA(fMet)-specific endonuclease VapC
LCSVVRAELLFGAFRSKRQTQNLERTNAFLAGFQSLPFDDEAAYRYALIRAELSAKGQLIGPNDLLIAATALAHGAILVTHNSAEFSRVPGLLIEDWEA